MFPAGRDGAPGGRWFDQSEDDKATWRVLPASSSKEVVYTVSSWGWRFVAQPTMALHYNHARHTNTPAAHSGARFLGQ